MASSPPKVPGIHERALAAVADFRQKAETLVDEMTGQVVLTVAQRGALVELGVTQCMQHLLGHFTRGGLEDLVDRSLALRTKEASARPGGTRKLGYTLAEVRREGAEILRDTILFGTAAHTAGRALKELELTELRLMQGLLHSVASEEPDSELSKARASLAEDLKEESRLAPLGESGFLPRGVFASPRASLLSAEVVSEKKSGDPELDGWMGGLIDQLRAHVNAPLAQEREGRIYLARLLGKLGVDPRVVDLDGEELGPCGAFIYHAATNLTEAEANELGRGLAAPAMNPDHLRDLRARAWRLFDEADDEEVETGKPGVRPPSGRVRRMRMSGRPRQRPGASNGRKKAAPGPGNDTFVSAPGPVAWSPTGNFSDHVFLDPKFYPEDATWATDLVDTQLYYYLTLIGSAWIGVSLLGFFSPKFKKFLSEKFSEGGRTGATWPERLHVDVVESICGRIWTVMKHPIVALLLAVGGVALSYTVYSGLDAELNKVLETNPTLTSLEAFGEGTARYFVGSGEAGKAYTERLVKEFKEVAAGVWDRISVRHIHKWLERTVLRFQGETEWSFDRETPARWKNALYGAERYLVDHLSSLYAYAERSVQSWWTGVPPRPNLAADDATSSWEMWPAALGFATALVGTLRNPTMVLTGTAMYALLAWVCHSTMLDSVYSVTPLALVPLALACSALLNCAVVYHASKVLDADSLGSSLVSYQNKLPTRHRMSVAALRSFVERHLRMATGFNPSWAEEIGPDLQIRVLLWTEQETGALVLEGNENRSRTERRFKLLDYSGSRLADAISRKGGLASWTHRLLGALANLSTYFACVLGHGLLAGYLLGTSDSPTLRTHAGTVATLSGESGLETALYGARSMGLLNDYLALGFLSQSAVTGAKPIVGWISHALMAMVQQGKVLDQLQMHELLYRGLRSLTSWSVTQAARLAHRAASREAAKEAADPVRLNAVQRVKSPQPTIFVSYQRNPDGGGEGKPFETVQPLCASPVAGSSREEVGRYLGRQLASLVWSILDTTVYLQPAKDGGSRHPDQLTEWYLVRKVTLKAGTTAMETVTPAPLLLYLARVKDDTNPYYDVRLMVNTTSDGRGLNPSAKDVIDGLKKKVTPYGDANLGTFFRISVGDGSMTRSYYLADQAGADAVGTGIPEFVVREFVLEML